MRHSMICGLILLSGISARFVGAQQGVKRFENHYKPSAEEFVTSKPAVGEPFPNLEIFTSDGRPFETASLRGHYTLITLGCLTCPPFLGNVPALEAAYRDYQAKGVKFFDRSRTRSCAGTTCRRSRLTNGWHTLAKQTNNSERPSRGWSTRWTTD